jgi:hypothetical protein
MSNELSTTESVNILAVIERAAINPEVNVDKMRELLAMQKDIMAIQSERDFNLSMNSAQAEICMVATDAENKQTHSRYATYAALDKAIRPIYVAHGFSLSFDTESVEGEFVLVLCYVAHRGGHTRKYRITIPSDGKGAKGGDVMTKTHAVGSASSYGMRYLLKMIFNVPIGEDDDGNGAGRKAERISAEQVANLECLATEVGADLAAFLKFYSSRAKFTLSRLEEIPVTMYSDAVAMMETKRKKVAK